MRAKASSCNERCSCQSGCCTSARFQSATQLTSSVHPRTWPTRTRGASWVKETRKTAAMLCRMASKLAREGMATPAAQNKAGKTRDRITCLRTSKAKAGLAVCRKRTCNLCRLSLSGTAWPESRQSSTPRNCQVGAYLITAGTCFDTPGAGRLVRDQVALSATAGEPCRCVKVVAAKQSGLNGSRGLIWAGEPKNPIIHKDARFHTRFGHVLGPEKAHCQAEEGGQRTALQQAMVGAMPPVGRVRVHNKKPGGPEPVSGRAPTRNRKMH